MRNIKFKSIFQIILILSIISCEKDTKTENIGFRIEFSDGSCIRETDISHYDSSTCVLFLNQNLIMTVGVGEPPTSCTQFSVYVDDEEIYDGGLYPDFSFNSKPLTPIYISSKTYPIIESRVLPIYGFRDVLNDSRIIKRFKTSRLLSNGIYCTIDSLKIVNDTTMQITLTIQNQNDFNQYVPDPDKMGITIFNAFGTVILYDIETNEHNSTKTDFWVTSELNFSMSDLSLVKKMDKITYKYVSPVYKPIKKGLYNCGFMIDNNRHFLPFPIPINREDGKVWVGYHYTPFKRMMVE